MWRREPSESFIVLTLSDLAKVRSAGSRLLPLSRQVDKRVFLNSGRHPDKTILQARQFEVRELACRDGK